MAARVTHPGCARDTAQLAAVRILGRYRSFILREALTRLQNTAPLRPTRKKARASLEYEAATELRTTARKLDADPAYGGIALRLRQIADGELRTASGMADSHAERVMFVNELDPEQIPKRVDRLKTQLVKVALVDVERAGADMDKLEAKAAEGIRADMDDGALTPTGLAYFSIAEGLDLPTSDVADFKDRLVKSWTVILRQAKSEVQEERAKREAQLGGG